MDQLTDRMALLGLVVTLTAFYPKFAFCLILSAVLDVSSHWAHVWATLLHGKASHKQLDAAENPILRIYYSNKVILFTLCAGNEAFYGFLYLLHFYSGPVVSVTDVGSTRLFQLLVWITAPIAGLKAMINVIQLVVACTRIAVVDVSERVNERAKRAR